MSLQSQLARISSERDIIRTKMISVGQAKSTDKLATLATNLDILDTRDATAVASDVISGKTCYVKGNKVTGTMGIISSETIKAILDGTY